MARLLNQILSIKENLHKAYFLTEDDKAKFEENCYKLGFLIDSHKNNGTLEDMYRDYLSNSVHLKEIELFDIRVFRNLSLKNLLTSEKLEKLAFVIENYHFFRSLVIEKETFVIGKLKNELQLAIVDCKILSTILAIENINNVFKDLEINGFF